MSEQKYSHRVRKYMNDAKDLEHLKVKSLSSTNQLLKKLVLLLVGALIVSLIALTIAVMFRKDAEPVIVTVDKNTGESVARRPLGTPDQGYDEVMTKYFLNKYIVTRESYDWFRISDDVDAIALLSSPDVNVEYVGWVQDEYLRKYEGKKKVLIKVLGFTLLSNKTAQIRFKRMVQNSDGTSSIEEPDVFFISTVTFAFERSNLTQTQRNINPLGFKVYAYKRDQDIASIQ